MPTKRTKEGVDPNVYRLMAKAGYNHEKPSGLGKLIPEASRKEGQKTLKAKGVGQRVLRLELDTPHQLLFIFPYEKLVF